MVLLTLLASGAVDPRPPEAETEERPDVQTSRVFLPPPAVLRQVVPVPVKPRSVVPATPRPKPTPQGKDRISVGPPSNVRAKGPLELRKEDDLTKAPKGSPNGGGAPAPPAPTPEPRTAEGEGGSRERPGVEGLALPSLRGVLPPGEGGRTGSPGPERPTIAETLRQLDRDLERDPLGIAEGTGRQMGPLFFDPLGADFTLWINHFKNEVYRNWLIPQSVVLGVGGEVHYEFTVQRDGRMTDLNLLQTSGSPPLDRAARGALLGSRLLPLPGDYRPDSVTMRVTFFYGQPPRGS
jgi:TonB family protein